MSVIFAFLILSSIALIVSPVEIKREEVRDCNAYCRHLPQDGLNKCCTDRGYLEKEGRCESYGTAFPYAYCGRPTYPIPGNVEMIRELKSEVSRLKHENELFQEKLTVCDNDHKKYVESMVRTKAIIEGIISGKNE